MKLARCKDHGFDCSFEARGATEEEVLQQVAQHATSVHGLEITPELVTQVRSKMLDVPGEASSS